MKKETKGKIWPTLANTGVRKKRQRDRSPTKIANPVIANDEDGARKKGMLAVVGDRAQGGKNNHSELRATASARKREKTKESCANKGLLNRRKGEKDIVDHCCDNEQKVTKKQPKTEKISRERGNLRRGKGHDRRRRGD